MKVFVLEDDPVRILWFRERFFNHDLTVATSVKEGVEAFKGPYDLVCLDHDLGGRQMVDSDEEETGATFVRRMLDKLVRCDAVFVHSYNAFGAKRMGEMLGDAGAMVAVAPFRGPSFIALLDGYEKRVAEEVV